MNARHCGSDMYLRVQAVAEALVAIGSGTLLEIKGFFHRAAGASTAAGAHPLTLPRVRTAKLSASLSSPL
jgi:hypothetical protein